MACCCLSQCFQEILVSICELFRTGLEQFQSHRPLPNDFVRCRTHAHRNAEIFSYILDGELTHQDSMGNSESLPRGCVQYLSAGTGIRHSVSPPPPPLPAHGVCACIREPCFCREIHLAWSSAYLISQGSISSALLICGIYPPISRHS